MKKVLLLNGSPHQNGNTALALREIRTQLEKHGIEAEEYWLGTGAIQGCIACYGCKKGQGCVVSGDVNRVAELLSGCDGLIVGSPVYYAGPNGALCAFLDRLFCSHGKEFDGKCAASVAVCRRGGASAALDRLNKYFSISNMPQVPSQYWNLIHGRTQGEAAQDAEGLQTMRTLADNMAWMLQALPQPPEREPKEMTNFIR